jgi:hypothetical protein
MDLRTWIIAEHDEQRTRFEDQVVAPVPLSRWTDRADRGGSSIAWCALHSAYHHDLAVSAAILDRAPLLAERRGELGLGVFDPWVGIGETEDVVVTGLVALEALLDYARDVHERAGAWLRSMDPADLDLVPDSSARLVERAGVPVEPVAWFHSLWQGRPVGWLVRWACIGHVQNHLGEMVSVRNRLGLSPF